MVIDDRTELASRAALPTGLGRTLVADVIDLTSGGMPDGLYLVVMVAETATSGGAAVCAFEVVTDAQGAIATDGSATQHFSTGPIPVAQLVAGAMVLCVQMATGGAHERYFGVLANVTGAALSGGRVSIFLSDTPAGWRPLCDNVR